MAQTYVRDNGLHAVSAAVQVRQRGSAGDCAHAFSCRCSHWCAGLVACRMAPRCFAWLRLAEVEYRCGMLVRTSPREVRTSVRAAELYLR